MPMVTIVTATMAAMPTIAMISSPEQHIRLSRITGFTAIYTKMQKKNDLLIE